MLLRVLTWTVYAYLVLKVAHTIARPSAGYGGAAATLQERLAAGEPMLLIGALVFSLTTTIYSDWWHHRLARREYFHSKGCYVQIETVKLLPRGRTGLDPYEAQEHADIYLENGQKHGAWLGWRKDPIRRVFERASLSYLARYARDASPRKEADLLRDVGRCYRDDWAAHGDIFNP